MAEVMKATVASMLKGIDRYNPENLVTLEKYVDVQSRENAYDLEANLAVLKLYQFNPLQYRLPIVQLVLLKALTNLPHTDFVLCKCLIDKDNLEHKDIKHIVYLHDLLETCQFTKFWSAINQVAPTIMVISGFEDSIRKFICHVVNITYQTIEKNTLSSFLGGLPDFALKGWMSQYGWKECGQNLVFVGNQEENIKTKNITEKIDFDTGTSMTGSVHLWENQENKVALKFQGKTKNFLQRLENIGSVLQIWSCGAVIGAVERSSKYKWGKFLGSHS